MVANGLICAAYGCSNKATRTVSNGARDVHYCSVHSKIRDMRGKARKRGKSVPSVADLEILFKENNHLKCPCCSKQMAMRSDGAGTRDVVSLQHDSNGQVRLLCHSCNSSHGQKPSDMLYFIPETHKYCAKCGDIRLKHNFYPNTTTRDGLQGYCKTCQSDLARERRKAGLYKG